MNAQPDIVERLMAYRRNELPESDRAELEGMLERDADLRDLNDLLDRMDDLKHADQDDPSAQAAHMLAMHLFGDWLLQRRKAEQAKQNNNPQSSNDGVRSIGAEHMPQLGFRMGSGLLTVSVLLMNEETCELIGQVEGIEPRPTFVECISRTRRSTADIDEHGLFRFAIIATGRISLVVSSLDGPSERVEFVI